MKWCYKKVQNLTSSLLATKFKIGGFPYDLNFQKNELKHFLLRFNYKNEATSFFYKIDTIDRDLGLDTAVFMNDYEIATTTGSVGVHAKDWTLHLSYLI